MTPPVEALSAVPVAMPSLAWAAVRMVLVLGAVALTAWAVMKWNRRSRSSQSHMKVLDRTFLARGTSIALVRVDDRRLLLGISSDGVRLLRDLDTAPGGKSSPRFGRILDDLAGKEETAS